MSHLDKAKQAANATDTTSPAYGNVLLRGILNALLALHEQNEHCVTIDAPAPRPTRTRSTTKKADQ